MIPPIPAVEERDRATGKFSVRYEDIAEDGRLLLETCATALTASVWRPLVFPGPFAAMMLTQGIIPILTRLIFEGTPGPFSVESEMHAEGLMQLAHARRALSPESEVERIYLNMWSEVSAQPGRTYGSPPTNAGERIVAGRVFGEHVLTRLFAAPEERKVTRLDVPGLPDVPDALYAPKSFSRILETPDDVDMFDADWVTDETPIVFGLRHTDSNQHVNSLVYPRVFEDAVLRHLAKLGKPTRLLARALEVGFRKPCFAGETVRVTLRTYRLPSRDASLRFGACGMFLSEEDARTGFFANARPRAYVSAIFES